MKNNQNHTQEQLILESICAQSKSAHCPQRYKFERVFMLACDNLDINNDHPFRLYNDEQLADLAGRIKQSGLLNPIIVRPDKSDSGRYEILSGRNRVRAVMLNGDKEIEAFIREVDDDTATLIMLNANIGQRKNMLISEIAKAYRMEAEILNRNGKRPDLSLGKKCPSYDTREIMGEKYNKSKRMISNYIRLAYLIPALLSLVDEKKLQILSGVEISYLTENEQECLLEHYISKGVKPKPEQLAELKRLSKSKEEKLNNTAMQKILISDKPKSSEFIRLRKKNFLKYSEIIESAPDIEQLFLELLEAYRSKGGISP